MNTASKIKYMYTFIYLIHLLKIDLSTVQF